MKRTQLIRTTLLAIMLAGGAASLPASAQINVTIGIAPPPLQVEAPPVLRPGYVFAPGHWAWSGSRYVWVSGRAVVQREGYRWAPDTWKQRDGKYYREVGRWERDPQWRPRNTAAPKQNGRHDNRNYNPGKGTSKGKGDGNGKGNGNGKGRGN